jgi:hypothetical protein
MNGNKFRGAKTTDIGAVTSKRYEQAGPNVPHDFVMGTNSLRTGTDKAWF